MQHQAIQFELGSFGTAATVFWLILLFLLAASFYIARHGSPMFHVKHSFPQPAFGWIST